MLGELEHKYGLQADDVENALRTFNFLAHNRSPIDLPYYDKISGIIPDAHEGRKRSLISIMGYLNSQLALHRWTIRFFDLVLEDDVDTPSFVFHYGVKKFGVNRIDLVFRGKILQWKCLQETLRRDKILSAQMRLMRDHLYEVNGTTPLNATLTHIHQIFNLFSGSEPKMVIRTRLDHYPKEYEHLPGNSLWR